MSSSVAQPIPSVDPNNRGSRVSNNALNAGHLRVERECDQLLRDIRRIGTPNEPRCTFGELFDDAAVEQYYEALVGTLKSAKKRKLVHFPGQFLLKGVHDRVTISIVGEDKQQQGSDMEVERPPLQRSISSPVVATTTRRWKKPVPVTPIPAKEAPIPTSPVPAWKKKRAQSIAVAVNKAKEEPSSMTSPTSSSAYHLRGFTNTSSQVATARRKKAQQDNTSPAPSSILRRTVSTGFEEQQQQQQPEMSHQMRSEMELAQLVKDIQRIGNPKVPYCTFGQLFDDPKVEQYYEALVGTLKSAKKRNLITFDGQMLLKGIHDKVIIRLVKKE